MLKIIALGIVVNMFIGCSKERQNMVEQTPIDQIDESTIIDNNKYPFISVKNGVLCFQTKYYESIFSEESEDNSIEELAKYLNSTSFKSYGKKYKEKSEYNEPFMDAIMNEDKIIKIGEWFIHIDIPNEIVLAISDKEENAYSSLLVRSNPNIKKFSVGDDVLDHLLNGSEPITEGCGGIGGGTYGCYSYVSQGKIIKEWSGGSVWRLWPYIKFFRAGIYFKLSSNYLVRQYESKNATGAGKSLVGIDVNYYADLTIEMFIRHPHAWWKKKPCKSTSIGTKSGGFHYSGTSATGSRSVYTGTRNLNGYYFYVQGRAKYSDGTYTGATPYGGRNINSPY